MKTRYISTVTYNDVDEKGKPFLCKEKFSVFAESLHYANNITVNKMREQGISEFDVVDICHDRSPMTMADHAEAWAANNEIVVPRRNTPEWDSMYQRWIEFAFADFQ